MTHERVRTSRHPPRRPARKLRSASSTSGGRRRDRPAQAAEADDARHEGQRVHQQRAARAEGHHQQARDRRPEHQRARVHQAAQRVGLLQLLAGDELGHEAVDGRLEEGVRGPVDQAEQRQVPPARLVGDQEETGGELAEQPHDVRAEHQRPPVRPVGDHPRDQGEDEERDRGRGGHQPHLGRAGSRGQHGERQRDHGDAVAEPRERLSDEQQPELRLLAQDGGDHPLAVRCDTAGIALDGCTRPPS